MYAVLWALDMNVLIDPQYEEQHASWKYYQKINNRSDTFIMLLSSWQRTYKINFRTIRLENDHIHQMEYYNATRHPSKKRSGILEQKTDKHWISNTTYI